MSVRGRTWKSCNLTKARGTSNLNSAASCSLRAKTKSRSAEGWKKWSRISDLAVPGREKNGEAKHSARVRAVTGPQFSAGVRIYVGSRSEVF